MQFLIVQQIGGGATRSAALFQKVIENLQIIVDGDSGVGPQFFFKGTQLICGGGGLSAEVAEADLAAGDAVQEFVEFGVCFGAGTSENLILDLTGVPYIDSAGLGVILSAWAHSQRTGTKFAVAGVSDRVRVLLDMTKVESMLPQFATAEEADRSFKGAAASR